MPLDGLKIEVSWLLREILHGTDSLSRVEKRIANTLKTNKYATFRADNKDQQSQKILENKMNIPEIERLITDAIYNRPKVTTAPLNLYLYESKLVCGARIVMPKNAKFIAYVPDNCLEKGFSDKEWKLIVQKINLLANNRYDDDNKTKETSDQKQLKQAGFNDRRAEQRLYYRRPMWYSQSLSKTRHKGQMVDISSNGMGFTCSMSEQTPLAARQKITTRLDVPLFGKDGSYDMVRFDRTGQIRKVEKLNNSIHRIALEFTQPLPFKPAEQGLPTSVIKQKLAAL